ncbi:MAG: glycoside hydrolase family 20 zincin-like fold domain-containing protein [Bacteroidales bacterium]
MKKNLLLLVLLSFLLFTEFHLSNAQGTELWNKGISLIPYPQKVEMTGKGFVMKEGIAIHIGQDASPEDQFTAQELVRLLHEQFNITGRITRGKPGKGIQLTRDESVKEKGEQAYHLSVTPNRISIHASGAAGLFYGMQTLVQLIQQKEEVLYIEGMEIDDWPNIIQRAVHYDSKHFQERFDYVKSFIRTLAAYKINMLVWEWEDKFAYPSHPEIGAPGAFTMEEIQELTRFAQQYHIQIVPLVQGLGHVSYLLKWPQHRHLREIQSSNWEICPLKDASYELLFDLWEDAIEATPGSQYIHIGSDETWELGSCELCRLKSEEIGISGLYHLFIKRAGEHLQEKGRKVMCWETPMGWKLGRSPARGIEPLEDLVLTESYNYETHDFQYAKQARELGYELFIYDPNPGIEHLFLPYFYRLDGSGEETISHLEQSHISITKSASSGYYQGIISTSWNCSGVHNQIWMLRYITAAEYAWSYSQPELSEFADKYFVNYYGPQSQEVKELFNLLNEASYFYMDAFERKVWHWGEIGKTHLPDLPRDDIEFDPYWNSANQAMIGRSVAKLPDMVKALKICETNLALQVRHKYDFELFRGIAELFRHTAHTYLALSALENKIAEAHQLHFEDSNAAYEKLLEAVQIVEENLVEREQVFSDIKTTWEKEQFPKGMSTPGQSYHHARDRQRNFANRRPDLTFMIYDEELLGLEDYLRELVEYKDWYKSTYLTGYEK